MFGTKKTLTSILAGFNKAVDDLEHFSNTSRQEAKSKRIDAETLQLEALDLDTNATKAEKIRNNILSMLEE